MTSDLEEGRVVRAGILGFLPGRRVLLDVEGRTLLAVSDLPLIRGEVVSAVIEAGNGRPRLRVIDPEDTPAQGRLREAAAPDDLDLYVSRTAADLGLEPGAKLLDGLRTHLLSRQAGLRFGPVPFERMRQDAFAFLAVVARGLPPSERPLAAVRVRSDIRLGPVLQRLVESLGRVGETAHAETQASDYGRRILGFFLDLNGARAVPDLMTALDRCGYGYEARLAARGHKAWEVDPELERTDLKGALLALVSWLEGLETPRRLVNRHGARLALDRARAFCGQGLDLIEGIQVQNLPAGGAHARSALFQVPVLWTRDPLAAGTLFLLFAEGQTRVWLDVPGGAGVGGSLSAAADVVEWTLQVPAVEETGRARAGTEIRRPVGSLDGRPRTLLLRVVAEAPEATVDLQADAVPTGRVNVVV